MPQNDISLRFLSPLIPEIACVARASGVFLWAKLVMRELASVLDTTDDVGNQHFKENLARCLDSLPNELDDFYRRIVKRIPMIKGMRWETFVILETISRSDEALDPQYLLSVVACSHWQTLSQGLDQLKLKDDLSESERPTQQKEKEYIETATGGLVEVIKTPGSPVQEIVQFMHQSVKDFVQIADLISLIFGAAHTKLVHENGYTFMSKHSFITMYAPTYPQSLLSSAAGSSGT